MNLRSTYRPTPDDFRVTGQTLSCREGGAFDQKMFGTDTPRRITTGWTAVCRDRQARGISRKARIAGRA